MDDDIFTEMCLRMPIHLVTSLEKGRMVVASRDIREGEPVLFDDGCVRIPLHIDEACARCANVLLAQDVKCNECGLFYCSEQCRKAASSLHAIECHIPPSLFEVSETEKIEYSLLWAGMRAIVTDFLHSKGGTSRVRPYVLSLDSHQASFDVQFLQCLRRAAQRLLPIIQRALLQSDASLTCTEEGERNDDQGWCVAGWHASDLVQFWCAMNVNAHGCGGRLGEEDVAVGLFPLGAMVNHSCVANCAWSVMNGCFVVRAVTKIAQGHELTLPYVDLGLPTAERRHRLMRSKFFLCRCERCESPSELGRCVNSIRCPSCGGWSHPDLASLPLDEEAKGEVRHWRCESCSISHKSTQVQVVRSVIERANQLAVDGEVFVACDRLEELEGSLQKSLHPNNAVLADTYRALIRCALKVDDPYRAVRYTKKVLAILEGVLPEYHIDKAAAYYAYALRLNKLARLNTSAQAKYKRLGIKSLE
mmetsp:Transcript_48/g.83  ORF Transcript_48/g.83 Transcript_48/m.83 type:complete len:476 (+) Transcript_48:25-1452(+)